MFSGSALSQQVAFGPATVAAPVKRTSRVSQVVRASSEQHKAQNGLGAAALAGVLSGALFLSAPDALAGVRAGVPNPGMPPAPDADAAYPLPLSTPGPRQEKRANIEVAPELTEQPTVSPGPKAGPRGTGAAPNQAAQLSNPSDGPLAGLRRKLTNSFGGAKTASAQARPADAAGAAKRNLQAAGDAVSDAVQDGADRAVGAKDRAVGGAKDLLRTDASNTISGAVQDGASKVGNAKDRAVSGAKNALRTDASDAISGAVQDGANKLGNAKDRAVSGAKNALRTDASDAISGAVQDGANKLGNAKDKAVGGAKDALRTSSEQVGNKFGEKARDIKDSAKSAAEQAGDTLKAGPGAVVQGLKDLNNIQVPGPSTGAPSPLYDNNDKIRP